MGYCEIILKTLTSLSFAKQEKYIQLCVYPCPCNYFSDPQKPCTHTPAVITKYQKRISGPLLDRIDIHVEVPRVNYDKLSEDRVGEIRQYCKLQDEGQSLMRAAMSQLNLSARAYHRILKLARTIADLAGSDEIQSARLAEALQYLCWLLGSSAPI